VILALGYFACRLLAGLAREIASRRFKVQEPTARLLSQWVFVALLGALGVLSLILVKIPFQAFAFLGGALAIGVGFRTSSRI
jgi:potassium efflux system protein